ncbi:DNA polymerase epsilon subunit 2 [Coelomomyces lativittatus]|nr:DNA polymerase epsilon subunit 2 [Coelomomyces lativittatus]
MLPKMNLPPWVTKLVTKKLQKGVVTTNPCRLAYCGQEIVVFRRNLVHQMHRNALVVGDIKAEMGLPYHLARTLIDQSHVCPLPLHISPVLWDYAHTLHLYPLPTLLVIADTVDKFHEEYEHVNVVNPGSFATSHGFGFLVYYPKGQRVEMRCVKCLENRITFKKSICVYYFFLSLTL